jgi:hypothetical protein
MISKMEEIIFEDYCGIDLSGLKKEEIIDPTKIKVSPKVNEEIINKLNKEYKDLNRHKIILLLLNYGPSVEVDGLSDGEVKLLDGYIKTIKN